MCKNSIRQKLTQHRNSETETKETGGVRVSEGGHRNQSTKLRKEFLISRVNKANNNKTLFQKWTHQWHVNKVSESEIKNFIMDRKPLSRALEV